MELADLKIDEQVHFRLFSEEQVSKDQASKDQASKDQASDDKASDDKASDEQANDDRTDDDRSGDDQTSDDQARYRVSEEQAHEISSIEPASMSVAEARNVIGNRYEVARLLGYGGTGTVFEVIDKSSEKKFAIKILHKHLLHDKLSLRRFEREAKAAIAMTNPHIAAVYEYVIGNGGFPYILMDYLEGPTLEQVIASGGPMDYKRAMNLLEQIIEALAYAHSRGIVHRDIKPSNIIITQRDGGVEIAKLLDFSIAKAMSNLCIDLTQGFTQTGELLGSPFYMAPEQCTGEPVDPRTDIHALGVLFYELVSGQKPYQGRNSITVLLKVVRDKPQPLSASLDLPADFESMVMKCLEKDPESRYQNTAELLRILSKIHAGKPVNSLASVCTVLLKKPVLKLFCLILAFAAFVLPPHFMELSQGIKGFVGLLFMWNIFAGGFSIVAKGVNELSNITQDLFSKKTVNRNILGKQPWNMPVPRFIWLMSLLVAIAALMRTAPPPISPLSFSLTLGIYICASLCLAVWWTIISIICDGVRVLCNEKRPLQSKKSKILCAALLGILIAAWGSAVLNNHETLRHTQKHPARDYRKYAPGLNSSNPALNSPLQFKDSTADGLSPK